MPSRCCSWQIIVEFHQTDVMEFKSMRLWPLLRVFAFKFDQVDVSWLLILFTWASDAECWRMWNTSTLPGAVEISWSIQPFDCKFELVKWPMEVSGGPPTKLPGFLKKILGSWPAFQKRLFSFRTRLECVVEFWWITWNDSAGVLSAFLDIASNVSIIISFPIVFLLAVSLGIGLGVFECVSECVCVCVCVFCCKLSNWRKLFQQCFLTLGW